MGRISKRKQPEKKDRSPEKKLFRIGIYVRLSVDSDEKKVGTLENQVAICESHIRSLQETEDAHFEVVDIYSDSGESGAKLNRDEFTRLIQDVRMGQINCIMVKDLSRFIRNHVEAGNYIERVFPFLGVRFIAVVDAVDTFEKDFSAKQLSIDIKNLVNEMYSLDIAQKALSNVNYRREKGAFAGNTAPYGFSTIKEDRVLRLVPNEMTAPIVLEIYEVFIQMKCYKKVADYLTAKKLNPPLEYLREKSVHITTENPKVWKVSAVRRILKNEANIGNLVQADGTRVERAHEAIISIELFEQAHIIMEQISIIDSQKEDISSALPKMEDIYRDVLYCGICGNAVRATPRNKRRVSGEISMRLLYHCENERHRALGYRDKMVNSIVKSKLDELVLLEIETIFKMYLKRPRYYKKKIPDEIQKKGKELSLELARTERKLDHLSLERTKLYEKYAEGKVCVEAFKLSKSELSSLYDEELSKKRRLEEKVDSINCAEKELERFLSGLLKIKENRVLTYEVVTSLIRKIELLPENTICIYWSFYDELKEM